MNKEEVITILKQNSDRLSGFHLKTMKGQVMAEAVRAA